MTDISNDHQLDDIIRQTDKSVDVNVHGPGFFKVLNLKNHTVSDKRRPLARIFGNNEFRYYFVKRHGKPTVITNWVFTWKEGTSEVELEFDCTFQIGVATEDEAIRLIIALGGYESPTQSLYNLIDTHLHKVLTKTYILTTQQGSNVLEHFGASNGESQKLNSDVSNIIAADLGTTNQPFDFRCGFKLLSTPILRVQLSQIPTTFEVSDSAVECCINTSALLVLDNYQKFKASGLEDEEAIKHYMKSALDEATQLYLFGQPYYTVVRTFSEEISKEIESHIEKIADAIGYKLRMFQSLTDIESMDLLDGLRVDVSAEDTEYRTKNSTGHVKVGLSVEMTVTDFNLLKRLIKPGQSGIKSILQDEVVKICRDVISKVERKEFNLNFDNKVVTVITDALTEKLLSRYGLDVHVIKIEQEPTDDAVRFQTLSGNTQNFTLEIRPIADAGHGDTIRIESAFEIIGMCEDGWDAFENKDYGYRANSNIITPIQKAALTESVRAQLKNAASQDLEDERRAQAIRNELDDISLRIKQTIEAKLEKIPQLASAIRQAKHDASVRDKVEILAADAIKSEWGLEIKLRAFKRLQGQSEKTAQIKSTQAHRLLRNQTTIDTSQHTENVKFKNSSKQKYLAALMERREQLLLLEEDHDPDEFNEELEELNRRIEEQTPHTETVMDLKSAEALTSQPEVDRSWASDNQFLEDKSIEEAVSDNL